ncbi:hypothetical protein PM082_024406 [Marasmius tenuissimus]|nr:hypothetical protein PM082_024406 [Marasmius tenuissimus]
MFSLLWHPRATLIPMRQPSRSLAKHAHNKWKLFKVSKWRNARAGNPTPTDFHTS